MFQFLDKVICLLVPAPIFRASRAGSAAIIPFQVSVSALGDSKIIRCAPPFVFITGSGAIKFAFYSNLKKRLSLSLEADKRVRIACCCNFVSTAFSSSLSFSLYYMHAFFPRADERCWFWWLQRQSETNLEKEICLRMPL